MDLAHRLGRIHFLVTFRTHEIFESGYGKTLALKSTGPLSFDFTDSGATAGWTAGNAKNVFFSACFHSALLAEIRK